MWASDANLRPAKSAFSQAYSAPGPDADFADQDVPAAFDEEYEGNSDLAIDDERKAGAHAGDVNIDLVVFAQSFHWVHPDNALERLASILRPHGRLALLELGQAHAGSAVDQAAARPGTTPLLHRRVGANGVHLLQGLPFGRVGRTHIAHQVCCATTNLR